MFTAISPSLYHRQTGFSLLPNHFLALVCVMCTWVTAYSHTDWIVWNWLFCNIRRWSLPILFTPICTSVTALEGLAIAEMTEQRGVVGLFCTSKLRWSRHHMGKSISSLYLQLLQVRHFTSVFPLGWTVTVVYVWRVTIQLKIPSWMLVIYLRRFCA